MLGTVLRAGVLARPRELGKGDAESSAALKQVLQPARVRMGSSRGVFGKSSDARLPSGTAKRDVSGAAARGTVCTAGERVPWLPVPPVTSIFGEGFSSIPNPLLLIERSRLCAATGDSFVGHGLGRLSSRLSLREVTTETTNNS